MIRATIKIYFIFLLIFSAPAVYAFGINGKIDGCPYVFTKTTRLGGNSLDVKILQRILNSDSRTRIANTGPGSPGNETFVFGNATKIALKKFQTLYADLIPLQDGTINIDTAKVLNSLCRESVARSKATTTTVAAPIVPPPLRVSLSSDSPLLVKKIKVYLDTSNTIVKPTGDAMICDNCNVSEVRKMSPKKYLFIVIPNDGATSVDVQIEAGKIIDTFNNPNENASNNLIFSSQPQIISNPTTSLNTAPTADQTGIVSVSANTTATDANIPDFCVYKGQNYRSGDKVPFTCSNIPPNSEQQKFCLQAPNNTVNFTCQNGNWYGDLTYPTFLQDVLLGTNLMFSIDPAVPYCRMVFPNQSSLDFTDGKVLPIACSNISRTTGLDANFCGNFPGRENQSFKVTCAKGIWKANILYPEPMQNATLGTTINLYSQTSPYVTYCQFRGKNFKNGDKVYTNCEGGATIGNQICPKRIAPGPGPFTFYTCQNGNWTSSDANNVVGNVLDQFVNEQ